MLPYSTLIVMEAMAMTKMPTKEAVEPVARAVKVMKPNVANKKNPKEVARLESLLDDENYVAEEKIDGARVKALANRFYTKENNDQTAKLPHLSHILEQIGFVNIILDGELYYPGKTSEHVNPVVLSYPENAIAHQRIHGGIHYKVFDILRAPNGSWLTDKTYNERRSILERFFQQYIWPNPEYAKYIELVPMERVYKRDFKDKILASGGEGVILKHVDSTYQMDKKPKWVWMKIKQTDETDMVVMGYKPPTILYTGDNYLNWPYWSVVDGQQRAVTESYYKGWIGSIVLGGYVNGELKELCSVSGLTKELCQEISADPDAYIGRVAKMRYMELTAAGNFRHPTFLSWHADKSPLECRFTDKGRALTD